MLIEPGKAVVYLTIRKPHKCETTESFVFLKVPKFIGKKYLVYQLNHFHRQMVLFTKLIVWHIIALHAPLSILTAPKIGEIVYINYITEQ